MNRHKSLSFQWNRRNFIKTTSVAAGALSLGLSGLSQVENNPPARLACRALLASEVQARGWLLTQLTEDLHEGLPGLRDLIDRDVVCNAFMRQNLALTVPNHPRAIAWWPAWSEAVWHDGYVYAAFLSGNSQAIQRITQYVENILSHLGSDGYIGVYNPETRLLAVDNPQYGRLDGELPSQAVEFLALIAFYKYTGRPDVLQAIERAVQLTMSKYRNGVFSPLCQKSGSNSHIIAFADPIMQLYILTGNEEYLNFVAMMYEDYNLHPPRDHDLTREMLEDPTADFIGHGAHTAESFHIVGAVALLGNPKQKKLAAVATRRLGKYLTPGGALVSSEFINGQAGNGHLLYEHCTQADLLKSYAFLIQYTADTEMAERAARLVFNAVQGARMHPLKAVQYLSCDDRTDIPFPKRGTKGEVVTNFRLSSNVIPGCCPCSSGRHLPYYLSTTWMKGASGDRLILMNFAPSAIKTSIAGVNVRIIEDTEYPFGDKIVLHFAPEKPVAFELAIRQPIEGELTMVKGDAQYANRDGFLVLNKTWNKGDEIELMLHLSIVCESTQDGTAKFYRRGALVFGLPFASEIKAIVENPRWSDQTPSGLFEYDVSVPNKSAWGYRIDPEAIFETVRLDGDSLHPWQKPTVGLRGAMLGPDGQSVPVLLLPEGSSISRRVTFLDASHSAEEASIDPRTTHADIGY